MPDRLKPPGEARALIYIKALSVLMAVLAVLMFALGAMVGYMIQFMVDARNDRTQFQNEQRYVLCEHVGFDKPFCGGVQQWGQDELRRHPEEK